MVVLLLVAWLNIVYIAIPLYYLPLICVPQAYGNHFVVIAGRLERLPLVRYLMTQLSMDFIT